MRKGIALLLLCASPLIAEPVLVGSVRREPNLPAQLERLAVALETDLAVVLRGIGAEPVMESALAGSKPELAAPGLKSCSSDQCVRRILNVSGHRTMIVPVLERARNSENLNVNIFRLQGTEIRRESLLILFINIEGTKRREALETVLLQTFPRLPAKENPADPPRAQENAEKSDRKTRTVYVVTDPGGADVYVDGRLAGQTPLEVPASGQKQTLRISKPGYHEVSMPLSTSGRLEVVVSLIREGAASEAAIAGKHPYWGAFARSLLLPGLGQWSKGENTKALLFGAGAFGAAGLSAFNAQEERRRYLRLRESYRQSDVYLYAGSITPLVSQLGLLQYFLHGDRNYVRMVSSSCGSQVCKSYSSARRNTRISLSALGGIYLWGALDALLSGRPDSAAGAEAFSWAAVPVSDSDRGFVLAARVRF